MPDSSLIQLMWLASPALPVGGFSYSERLEYAVDKGLVATESESFAWLTDQLHLTLARGKLPAISEAIAAWRLDDQPRIAALNAWILQTREGAELSAQTDPVRPCLADPPPKRAVHKMDWRCAGYAGRTATRQRVRPGFGRG